MLEHLARDDQDLDGDQDTAEYRPYAVHEDFQHTVRALSDAGGAVVERYRYPDPYGETETEDASGSPLGPFASRVHHLKRLHGGVTDAATGLYDFRNRWLEPATGAWTARDPLGDVDSLNLYQAFLQVPAMLVDTFGLACTPCPGAQGFMGTLTCLHTGLPSKEAARLACYADARRKAERSIEEAGAWCCPEKPCRQDLRIAVAFDKCYEDCFYGQCVIACNRVPMSWSVICTEIPWAGLYPLAPGRK